MTQGPLAGYRIIELAGLGPAPFAAMVLSDLGAEVVRIDRPDAVADRDGPNRDILARGRRSIAVNLKDPAGLETVLRLVDRADVLIEGFRPGVTERLGLGPDVCAARNPKLVYGRMTGWGQEGPWSSQAGHDLNYIALAGALGHIGRPGEPPTIPLNLVGDFGGGGMLLALGVVSALLEAQRSGTGQVVDAAMVDGTALLMAMIWSFRAQGSWTNAAGTNLLDGGAPFYDVYATADARWVAIGPLEPQFYGQLLAGLGLDPDDLPGQYDHARWPELRARFAAVFATKTRAEWDAVFAGSDACYAPVLTMDEVADHPHLRARGTIVAVDGTDQPAPAPRFSRTPGAIQGPPPWPGSDTDAVLADWGFAVGEVADLRAGGVIA